MDQTILNWTSIGEMVKAIGPTGLILLMWFISDRDTKKILAQYKADMTDQREMYKNNVELVRAVTAIAENQQDVIIMNTRFMERLVDRIDTNQFCPMVRLHKVEGVQG